MMKKLSLLVVFIAALSFVVASCGGEQPKAKEDATPTEEPAPAPETETQAEEPQAEAMDLTAGKAVYEAKCQVCHMAEGQGMAPAFPPLAKSDYMLADIPRAIRQAREGSNEPITVNGVEYTTPMAPVELTDDELLNVMNYVLNSWGNEHGMLTMDDVTAAFAK